MNSSRRRRNPKCGTCVSLRRLACFISLIVVTSQLQPVHSTSYSKSQPSNSNYEDSSSDKESYPSAPANYQFKYAVLDNKYGSDFGHEEERNGATTKGQYRVLLPDGRTQIVTYTADKNGYRAVVTYEGGDKGDKKDQGFSSHKGAGGYGPPPSPKMSINKGGDYGMGGNGQGQLGLNSVRKEVLVPPPTFVGGAGGYGSSGNNGNGGSFMSQRRTINGRDFSFFHRY